MFHSPRKMTEKFDTRSFSLLLEITHSLAFMTTHTRWFSSYLTRTSFSFSLTDASSLILKVEVNQRFITGTLLFSIYLHDVYRLCHLSSSVILTLSLCKMLLETPQTFTRWPFCPLNMFKWCLKCQAIWKSGLSLLNLFYPILFYSIKEYNYSLKHILLIHLPVPTFDISTLQFP